MGFMSWAAGCDVSGGVCAPGPGRIMAQAYRLGKGEAGDAVQIHAPGRFFDALQNNFKVIDGRRMRVYLFSKMSGVVLP
jgi:hypothetical protein